MQFVIDVRWRADKKRWAYQLFRRTHHGAPSRLDFGNFRTRAEVFARAFYTLYLVGDREESLGSPEEPSNGIYGTPARPTKPQSSGNGSGPVPSASLDTRPDSPFDT